MRLSFPSKFYYLSFFLAFLSLWPKKLFSPNLDPNISFLFFSLAGSTNVFFGFLFKFGIYLPLLHPRQSLSCEMCKLHSKMILQIKFNKEEKSLAGTGIWTNNLLTRVFLPGQVGRHGTSCFCVQPFMPAFDIGSFIGSFCCHLTSKQRKTVGRVGTKPRFSWSSSN